MPASMNTAARRKASADFHAKRKAEGWRKVTVWLSPEALKGLEKIKRLVNPPASTDDAIRGVLLHEAQKAPPATKALKVGVRVTGDTGIGPAKITAAVPLAGTFKRAPTPKTPTKSRRTKSV